jgi:hypothetical protein
MVKAKKSKKSKPRKEAASNNGTVVHTPSSSHVSAVSGSYKGTKEDLDALDWLRNVENRRSQGEPVLQLEYQEDDVLMTTLQDFLETSAATHEVIDEIYQIWQQTVLSTLLASSALWKQETVQANDQRVLKDCLKTARYKINFALHHVLGAILTSPEPKWKRLQPYVIDVCWQTLALLPRLAESVPHHPTDLRSNILHFEGKEFLASVACETWDTLYDFDISLDPTRFVPILRKLAMLDILDKDWNMLGGWEDILKGLEAKCFHGSVLRLPCDSVLHEHTTLLRNARNSMQCKFFSVRFMRYTEDQAPQRWRYFPKCAAPACAHVETPESPHPHRCESCWYFHYCSPACQEYCDVVLGLHPKFCRDTPANKAASCQRETEAYLGWSDPQSGQPLVCHACGVVQEEVSGADSLVDAQYAIVSNGIPTSSMKRCSKCQKVYYCSRQCQEWDWRVGGHKRVCLFEAAQKQQQQIKELN